MHLERLTLDEWSDALPSSGFEPFHTAGALSTLDDYAAGDLELFGGFKGDQPIALLPAFVQERSIGTAVLSPPPGRGVPRLGPLVMPNSPKRSKQEKVNREFVDMVLDEVDAEERTTLVRMSCTSEYADPRPFVWSEFDVDTAFTYRLETADRDPEEIRKSFSKSLRREIGDAEDLGVTVQEEGIEGAREIYEDTQERYEEQDRPFQLSWPYVRDLVRNMDDRARAWVVRSPEGEFLSGITALYSNDHAYFWQGGTRGTYEGTSVNSLLHWAIIEDLAEEEPHGATGYDLMGANTERLCKYKAKFGADLVPYYVVESGGPGMDVAKKAYKLVGSLG